QHLPDRPCRRPEAHVPGGGHCARGGTDRHARARLRRRDRRRQGGSVPTGGGKRAWLTEWLKEWLIDGTVKACELRWPLSALALPPLAICPDAAPGRTWLKRPFAHWRMRASTRTRWTPCLPPISPIPLPACILRNTWAFIPN